MTEKQLVTKKTLLFVYGTLRTEFTTIGSRVCSDELNGMMFDLGGCPGCLIGDYNDSKIVGEVIEIDEAILPRLDAYEGVAHGLYSRERATTASGKEVFVYQINPHMIRPIARWIPNGDWLNPAERRAVQFD